MNRMQHSLHDAREFSSNQRILTFPRWRALVSTQAPPTSTAIGCASRVPRRWPVNLLSAHSPSPFRPPVIQRARHRSRVVAVAHPLPRGRMSRDCLEIEVDGFYHPASEADLCCLVRMANRRGLQLRVRGSAHSAARAIYTDPLHENDNRIHRQHPPEGEHLNVMLDRYRGWWFRDQQGCLIEVQAGVHLGANPTDPTGGGADEDGLLYQLFHRHGLTLENLGGTTHQTISGFLATGSAGASTRCAFERSVEGVRIVDGEAKVHEVMRGDPAFDAVLVSLGLLGAISTVILRCIPSFNIAGEERFTRVEACPVDIFEEDPDRTPLREWLERTEFGRMEWWPQPGGERLELWQAWRIPAETHFVQRAYRQFGNHPVLEQFGCAAFLTIIGNLDDLAAGRAKLRPVYGKVRIGIRELLIEKGLNAIFASALARAGAALVRILTEAATVALALIRKMVKKRCPQIFIRALNLFVPIDRGEGQLFHDHSWHGLPMDAEADDDLVPVSFTEAWVPLSYASSVLRHLRTYFREPQDPLEALDRTGMLTWELYMAPASTAWLSPSYSDGGDEWANGAFRIDPFWFANNPGNPAYGFFADFWRLLRLSDIPFRLHWGKQQPIIESGDPEGWVAYFRAQYPRWDSFLRLRKKMDPNNLFLSNYWRERFGLAGEPRPTPRSLPGSGCCLPPGPLAGDEHTDVTPSPPEPGAP